MGFARVLSRAQAGLAAPQVTVEVHLGSGLPTFSIVGLPAAAVKESRERVRAALATCGFELPAGRITVNLAPADLPKEGGRFDLPVALGILLASRQAEPRFDVARTEFYGELGLTGERAGGNAAAAPAPDAAAEQALHRARTAYDGVDGRLSALLEVLERAPSEALGQRVAALEVEAKAARDALEAAEETARQAETRLNAIKTRELAKASTAQPRDRRRANAALRALVREVAIDPGTGTMAVRWHLGGETSLAFAFPADEATTPPIRRPRQKRKATKRR